MINKTCKDLNDAIEKMQHYCDSEFYRPQDRKETDFRRAWLKATPEDSYKDPHYRVELWVLEGSPPVVVVVISHKAKTISCYTFWGKRIALFEWIE